jgi:ubiquinone/menaquinone biosynthesis C-methylase UbiE
MGYVFDYNAARQYDDWYQNPKNRFVAELEDELVLRLLEPVRGERVLDIGCGTGRHLLMFSELGLDITGLDASPHMLGIAQRKLGHRVELHEGLAEDLPFEDNSFDIATLITTLEFVDDAQKALQEACRVAENRILLGVLNRYAIKGIERRLRGIFSKSIYNRARFFSVWEVKQYVQEVLGKAPFRWGTVLHLPSSFRKYTQHLERWHLVQRLPFGCFIGMVVTLVPRFRTQNVPIGYAEQHTPAAPGLMKTPIQYGRGARR